MVGSDRLQGVGRVAKGLWREAGFDASLTTFCGAVTLAAVAGAAYSLTTHTPWDAAALLPGALMGVFVTGYGVRTTAESVGRALRGR